MIFGGGQVWEGPSGKRYMLVTRFPNKSWSTLDLTECNPRSLSIDEATMVGLGYTFVNYWPQVGDTWRSNSDVDITIVSAPDPMAQSETVKYTGLNTVFDTNVKGLWRGFEFVSHVAAPAAIDFSRYPSKCPRCTQPAYVGHLQVDCSNASCPTR